MAYKEGLVNRNGGRRFFHSGNVKVFPCAFRGRYDTIDGLNKYTFDPESMLNSEYNFTHLPGIGDGHTSYIIDYGDYKVGEAFVENTLRCVIGGYYFEIYGLSLNDLMDTSSTPYKTRRLYVRTKAQEIKEGTDSTTGAGEIDSDRFTRVLDSWERDNTTDTTFELDARLDAANYYFTGILIAADDADVAGYDAYLDVIKVKSNKAILNYDMMLPVLYHGMGDVSLRTTIDNVADGDMSFAQGNTTQALGKGAHSEGNDTVAKGQASHAEGHQTTANADWSHTEGNKTKTVKDSGKYGHAEGSETIVRGEGAHAEGLHTIATGIYSHAEGNGPTKDNSTHGALGNYSHSEGNLTIAKGVYSHSEGNSTEAQGEASHTEGEGTKALGKNSHAEGKGTVASNTEAHAEGLNTKATGNGAHAEGLGDGDTKGVASGDYSHVEGNYNIASGGYSHAEGRENKATANAAHAEGYLTEATGGASHAEGRETKASGYGAHASGKGTIASKDFQTVIGLFNKETNGEFIIGIGADNEHRDNALVINGTTATLKNTLNIINSLNEITFKTSPTQTDILTDTNNITGKTNTITGNTNIVKVGSAEKLKITSTNIDLGNTESLNITAGTTTLKSGTDEKLKITSSETAITNANKISATAKDIVISSGTGGGITTKGDITENGSITASGHITTKGSIYVGPGTGSDGVIYFRDIEQQNSKIKNNAVLRFKSFSAGKPENYGSGVILGSGGGTVIMAGECATSKVSNWETEHLYLGADNEVYIYTRLQKINDKDVTGIDKEGYTWRFTTDGNLICPGYIDSVIRTTCEKDNTKNLVWANMAANDYFRIQVGGAENQGWVEIATADDGNEPIIFRQYQCGDGKTWNSVAHTFTALDANGHTNAEHINTGSIYVGGSLCRIYATNQDQAGTFNINNKMCIHDNGHIFTWDTISAQGITSAWYDTPSDIRLKENLRPLETAGSILDLPVYKFDYKIGEKDQIGCIAQDLQKICPELVRVGENDYLEIQENKLVYLLLKEVKKLKTELEELKNK